MVLVFGCKLNFAMVGEDCVRGSKLGFYIVK